LTAVVLLVTVGATSMAGAAPPAQPGTPDTAARHVTFATYNVDFGADLAPLFVITNLPALIVAAHGVYQQMIASNYPERAAAIAHLLAKERPDLIGLQEADTWETLDLANPAAGFTMPPSNDFPALILADLAADGVPYDVTVRNKTAQAQLPIDTRTLVRYTDYNLVLTRSGVPTRMLSTSNSSEGQYAAHIPLPPLFSGVNVTRGWASVDVTVWGRTFRFFTTHLEAYSDLVRNLQAAQLAGMIANSTHPVVVTGDINSQPPECPNTVQTGAYSILESAGLVEVWPSAEEHNACGGFTAGQSSLTSPTSNLDHRIDVIFFQPSKWDAIQAGVIGGQLRDKTPSGLWPSDHAGSVATLKMTSGW
jgi:endonuclease/exonuclease/phosphatase family metal-dependent hydrolase